MLNEGWFSIHDTFGRSFGYIYQVDVLTRGRESGCRADDHVYASFADDCLYDQKYTCGVSLATSYTSVSNDFDAHFTGDVHFSVAGDTLATGGIPRKGHADAVRETYNRFIGSSFGREAVLFDGEYSGRRYIEYNYTKERNIDGTE
jgi:hypothetical protein